MGSRWDKIRPLISKKKKKKKKKKPPPKKKSWKTN